MKRNIRIVQILFAIPWLIFGIQHFMYADFVAGLVPEFMPFRLFWAYFTGAAMLAAGVSFIVNKAGWWAAIFLSLMLWIFVLLIHVPGLASKPFTASSLTRPMQDVLLAAATFLLAYTFIQLPVQSGIPSQIFKACRIISALMLIGIGVQQFFDLDFMTARIPAYFPLHFAWIYLTGLALIITGILVIVGKMARLATVSLGIYLLVINALNYVYLLALNLHEPILWTAAMIDLAITAAVFILAISLPVEDKSE